MPRRTPQPRTPRARRRRDRAALLAVASGAGLVLLLAGLLLLWLGPAPRAPTPFEAAAHLVASDGRPIDAGHYRLVYFGYSHCRDVCPPTLAAMAAALEALGPKGARVQPLFVTVDPARDTPAVLRAFLAPISPLLVGLTGPPEAIAAAARAFHVTHLIHAAAIGDDYTIDHSSVLFLIDPAGRLVAPLPADLGPAALARRLDRLVT
jgi:protein SCO1/2